MTKACFIVVEGLEGAGKSTAVSTISSFLSAKGIEFITTREPGGTALAEEIRHVVKKVHEEKLSDEAELLLMYAARVQLIEQRIKPALADGVWVIGDRHDLSSLAYQGGGRGIDMQLIHGIRDAVLKGFRPDLTIYMDVPADIGMQRVVQRGAKDRIEKEALTFFERVRDTYQAYANADDSIVTVDASQPLNTVQESLQQALTTWYDNQ